MHQTLEHSESEFHDQFMRSQLGYRRQAHVVSRRAHVRQHNRQRAQRNDMQDAFENTDELRSQDFTQIDRNTFILDNVKKMKCKEFAVEQDGTPTLQEVMTFLDTQEIEYVKGEKELQEEPKYTEEHLKDDQKKAKSLTEYQYDLQSTSDLLIQKEEEFFQQKRHLFCKETLDKFKYKKHRVTCSNNVEQYEYLNKDGKRVEIMIQKIRDVKEYTQFLRIFKKEDEKWVNLLRKPIQMSTSSCYAHCANISTLFEGQFLYFCKIKKDKTEKQKFKVSIVRFDLENNKQMVVNEVYRQLPNGFYVEAAKFITTMEVKASIKFIENPDKSTILSRYDVAFLYRIDQENDAFRFDIRKSTNLNEIKFKMDSYLDMVDVGGFHGWTIYNFPCFMIEEEQAEQEMEIKHELVVICPKKSIILAKIPGGEYKILSDIPFDIKKILEVKRKMMEDSIDINYKIIQDNFMTDKQYYTIELPFIDKQKTVNILNNTDQRCIQLIEQTKEKDFKYELKKLNETFRYEDVLLLKDRSELNYILAKVHPATDYQQIIYKNYNNFLYHFNPVKEQGKFTIAGLHDSIRDKNMELLHHFKPVIVERQDKEFRDKIRNVFGEDTKPIFLEKRSFIETVQDIQDRCQRVFIQDNGYPMKEPKKFKSDEWRDFSDKLLFIIQEQTLYSHNDRSIRPILLIETEGKFGKETRFKNIWLSFLKIDDEDLSLIHSTKLNFNFPPVQSSYSSAPQRFHLCMSSPMTVIKCGSKRTIYRQNYQVLNSSIENSIHEVLEFQVDYITENFKIIDVNSDMIGKAALITTESFNYNDAVLYPLFDKQNEVLGSQIIFNAKSGSKKHVDKVIYELKNPSNDDDFYEFYLTQVKMTNFKAIQIQEDDRACLTQVRYNRLRIQNAKIFTEYDKKTDLDYPLALALNFVSYDINRIFDKQGKTRTEDITCGYAPHLPTEILHMQNIINISSKNPSELQRILNLLGHDDDKNDFALSNIEHLLKTDKSSRRETFKNLNLLLGSEHLQNTTDMNFMSVLSHSLEHQSKVSTELILKYIFDQDSGYQNYELVMKNFDRTLDRKRGILMSPFLRYSSDQKLSLGIMPDDSNFDPNQPENKMIYAPYDHKKGEDQMVENLKSMYKKTDKNNDNTYKVRYCYINFNCMMFSEKLKQIEQATFESLDAQNRKMPRMNKLKLNMLINKIIKQTPNELHYQQIIRELIDNQFTHSTFSFNLEQLAIFLIGHYIPEMIIVFKEEDFLFFNMVSILVQAGTLGFFIDIERKQYYAGLHTHSYSDNKWNIVDALYIFATAIQLLMRSVRPYETYIPVKGCEDEGDAHGHSENFAMIMVNFLVMIFSTLKVLSLLRMFNQVGNLVQLLSTCLKQIGNFLVFQMLFIMGITTIYKMLGADLTDQKNYKNVNTFFRFLIETIHNAIGDIITPKYPIWDNVIERDPSNWLAIVMISLIWVIFVVFNILISSVVLMNFLIAIVSQSYILVMQNSTNQTFMFRSILNIECTTTSESDDAEKCFDIIYLAFKSEQNSQAQCGIQEVLGDTKQMIMQNINERIDHSSRDLKMQIDSVQEALQDEMQNIKEIVEDILTAQDKESGEVPDEQLDDEEQFEMVQVSDKSIKK